MPVTKKVVKKVVAKSKAPVKKVVAPVKKKVVAKKVVRRAAAEAPAMKACTTKFNRTDLIAILARKADVEPKAAKAVLTQLENVMQASIMNKGLGEFMLPGLFKIVTQKIPARKIPAIKKGTMVKNPFNGGKEEPHKGRPASVKPASIRVKIRPMKKLKDAAAS